MRKITSEIHRSSTIRAKGEQIMDSTKIIQFKHIHMKNGHTFSGHLLCPLFE